MAKWCKGNWGLREMGGEQHPDEDAFVDFAKKAFTQEYMKLMAAFIKNKYPGSADRVLPELRRIYAAKFRDAKHAAGEA